MIENIRKLGLNEYEARAYRALLSFGPSQAIAVSKKAGIPRARVYDVLFSLEKKGFVGRAPSKPARYSALKPTSAVEVLAKARSQQLEAEFREISAVAEAIEKASSPQHQGFQESAVLVEGTKNIYAFITQKLDSCRESVLISSTAEGLRNNRAFFSDRFRQLEKGGVQVISRQTDGLRFIVFDRHSVLLFLNDSGRGEESEKALLVGSPIVARHFYGKGSEI